MKNLLFPDLPAEHNVLRMPVRNPLLAKLAAVAELGGKDEQAVQNLCGNITHLKRGKDILVEGQVADNVYLILEGWAARYKILADGNRQIIAFLIPGDFCALQATVSGEMDHNIGTLMSCKIANIPSIALNLLLMERPRVAQAFFWSTLVEKAVLRAWLVNLGRRDAHERVAHLICELRARLKRVGLVNDNHFDLPLTQEVIADAVGLTQVHTNRVLQRLRAEGLIEYKTRKLTILDTARLNALGGFCSSYLKAGCG